MPGRDAQGILLQHYPMLRELPAAELDTLLAGASVINLPAGAVAFDENQPCQGFPLLLSGNARVIKSAANGREQIEVLDVPALQRFAAL